MIGFFPSSPIGREPGSPVDPSDRDGNWNGYTIKKLQYQKNIDPHSYLRGLVYGAYSNWFINGPQSAQLVFGSDPADYEVLEHGYGGSLIYANQLAPENLITAEASYMTQRLQTYNVGFSSTDPFTTSLAPTGLGHDSLELRYAERQVLQLRHRSAVELLRCGQSGRLPHAERMLSRRRIVPLQSHAGYVRRRVLRRQRPARAG